jgi:hypothetical protein
MACRTGGDMFFGRPRNDALLRGDENNLRHWGAHADVFDFADEHGQNPISDVAATNTLGRISLSGITAL